MFGKVNFILDIYTNIFKSSDGLPLLPNPLMKLEISKRHDVIAASFESLCFLSLQALGYNPVVTAPQNFYSEDSEDGRNCTNKY